MRGRRRVGLLGGSFDPIHRAHVQLALTALRELDLLEVQLIPAADPWQRPALAATPAQRLHMLQLAVQDVEGLRVNPMEIERGGASHTLTTVEALPQTIASQPVEYYWLLGSDQLNNFCTWHRWQDIARHVRLVVAQRPDSLPQPPPALVAHLEHLQRPLITLPFTPMPISATYIRQALAQQHQPTSLQTLHCVLDERVLHYILEHDLYRTPPAPTPAL